MKESKEADIEMRNQDLILMKNEEILFQKGNQMILTNVIDEKKGRRILMKMMRQE